MLHIADIHIGAVPRENILAAATKIPSGDLFILGDVFHYKTRYSPSDVLCFEDMLAVLGPRRIFIICGNHDCVVSEPSVADCLLPLVGEVLPNIDFGDAAMPSGPPRRQNVYYLRRSGKYLIDGLNLTVISQWCKMTAAEISASADSKSILLFHGCVEGVGWGTPIITKEILNKFSHCMLGDYHQWIQPTPRSAYSGSLVQQNLGEGHLHGVVSWKDGVPSFIDLDLPPLFISIDIRGKTSEEAIKTISELPSGAPIRTRICGGNSEVSQGVIAAMAEKYGRVDILGYSPSFSEINRAAIIEKFRAVLGEDSANLADEFLSQMVDQKRAPWRPVWMEWSNYGKYGEGNRVEFHRGITGIVAKNCAGKSTLLDVFILCLFNYAMRGDAKGMIRRGQAAAKCTVCLEVNGVLHIVNRIDQQTRCMVSFSPIDTPKPPAAGNVLSVYGEISSRIGDWRSFLRAEMVYSEDVMRETPRARLESLPPLLGLRDCITLTKTVAAEHKAAKARLSALVVPRATEIVDTAAIEENICQIRGKIAAVENQISSLDAIIDELAKISAPNIALQKEYQASRKISPSLVEEFPCEDSPHVSYLGLRGGHNFSAEPQGSELSIEELYSAQSQRAEMPSGSPRVLMTLEEAKAAREAPRALPVELCEDPRGELAKIPATNLSALREIAARHFAAGQFHFANDCESCQKNKALSRDMSKDIEDAEREEARRSILSAQIAWMEYSHWLSARETLQAFAKIDAEKIYGYCREFARRQDEIRAVHDRFLAYQSARRQNEEYRRGSAILEQIKDTSIDSAKIAAANSQRAELRIEARRLSSELGELIARREYSLRENKIYEEYQSVYPELCREEARLRLYSSLLKSGTFRQAIISQHLANLVSIANAVLQEIADFRLSAFVDDSGAYFRIEENGIASEVSVASGFQRYISSIAFRMALIQYTCSGRFLMIDEGFSTIDGDNMKRVSQYLLGAESDFHFLLIISHHPDMRGVYSREINIAEGATARIGTPAAAPVVPIAPTADKFHCPCGKVIKNTFSAISAHRKTEYHLKNAK